MSWAKRSVLAQIKAITLSGQMKERKKKEKLFIWPQFTHTFNTNKNKENTYNNNTKI